MKTAKKSINEGKQKVCEKRKKTLQQSLKNKANNSVL